MPLFGLEAIKMDILSVGRGKMWRLSPQSPQWPLEVIEGQVESEAVGWEMNRSPFCVRRSLTFSNADLLQGVLNVNKHRAQMEAFVRLQGAGHKEKGEGK